MRKRIEHDLAWLRAEGLDTFHRYAFGSIRQCGSNAELAADYVDWLAGVPGRRPRTAAGSFLRLAEEGMKGIEFLLARACGVKQGSRDL